jgi:myosin heavy subunit
MAPGRLSHTGRLPPATPHTMRTYSPATAGRTLAACALLAAVAACGDAKAHAAADSALANAASEQLALSTQLASQKDSLMQVVLDADAFIAQVDSQMSRVKNLPRRERKQQAEGVLQDQLEARQDMLFKVDALVDRAQATARQLAEAQRREASLRRQNTALTDSLSGTERMIAQLGETIQRQATQIGDLQSSVLQLTADTTRLNDELRVSLASNARVYYIIGREDELLKKGIIVKEGGMNLLVGRVGKTLQAARNLDPDHFTAIDARQVSTIPVPDSTRTYRVISRQSLDEAEVRERNKTEFKGALRITNPNRFWAPSRYLIVVQS